MNISIKDDDRKLHREAELDLAYALKQREELKLEIKRYEADLAYKYPVYKLLKDADAGRRGVDYQRLLSAAENSGAYKSREWFSLYLAIARQNVWQEVAALICIHENGYHDFINMNNNGAGDLVCKHCGSML